MNRKRDEKPPPDAPTPQPWDRRPGEPSRAYETFCLYRDTGPQRSLDRTRRNLGKAAGYTRWIETWSTRWAWVERATAWDDHVDRERREATGRAMREMLDEQIQTAKLLQRALTVPARELVERLDRHDPATMKAIQGMPFEDLEKLIVATGRALRIPVAIEWGARGYRGHLASADEEDQPASGVDALDEVLNRLEAADKTRKERARQS